MVRTHCDRAILLYACFRLGRLWPVEKLYRTTRHSTTKDMVSCFTNKLNILSEERESLPATPKGTTRHTKRRRSRPPPRLGVILGRDVGKGAKISIREIRRKAGVREKDVVLLVHIGIFDRAAQLTTNRCLGAWRLSDTGQLPPP